MPALILKTKGMLKNVSQ